MDFSIRTNECKKSSQIYWLLRNNDLFNHYSLQQSAEITNLSENLIS